MRLISPHPTSHPPSSCSNAFRFLSFLIPTSDRMMNTRVRLVTQTRPGQSAKLGGLGAGCHGIGTPTPCLDVLPSGHDLGTMPGHSFGFGISHPLHPNLSGGGKPWDPERFSRPVPATVRVPRLAALVENL